MLEWWVAFLLWAVQLVALGTFAQFVFWLYGVDGAVQAYLSQHRDGTTIALISYFACFIIYRNLRRDARLTKIILSTLRKGKQDE